MILWGGSGMGKATIARIMASAARRTMYEINSTNTITKEFAEIISKAAQDSRKQGTVSIVFCDEIHRITKPQQDLFLNAVQNRQIIILGVTTDNASLNPHHSLVYKCSVFTLKRPTGRDIERMILRSIHSQKLQSSVLDDEFVSYLASLADGGILF